jgi:hypothetical protein
MSTVHNRGPPAAWQGPNEIKRKRPNSIPTPCYPSAQRMCHLTARPLMHAQKENELIHIQPGWLMDL